MQKISVVIPAYNEEKGIGQTIKEIKEVLKKVKSKTDILVVNDGSTDNTANILAKIDNIRVIEHETNRGYGASLKTAIRNTDSDYIMIIDADGTYPIKSIPKLIELSSSYDMVVGARSGKTVKIPFFRKPAKWIISRFAEYLTMTKIPDLNSGLRIFKRDVALKFMSFFPDGFSFTTTLTMSCLTNDYRVKYITIDYFERKGTSTIHPIKDFVGFINLIFRLTIYFRPLNVFIPISLIIFLGGVIKLYIDFSNLNYFGLGGTLLILSSIQIAFLGILADLIIKRTKL